MKEALKLCVAELREARGDVEGIMHECADVLETRRVEAYQQQLARIDAAVAAAEAATAQPEPEPVAWMHEDGESGIVLAAEMEMARRHGGATLFRLRGFTVPLYAGSALAQSLTAHPTP